MRLGFSHHTLQTLLLGVPNLLLLPHNVVADKIRSGNYTVELQKKNSKKKSDNMFNVLSKFPVLCWVGSLATLKYMQPMSCELDAPRSGMAERFLHIPGVLTPQLSSL